MNNIGENKLLNIFLLKKLLNLKYKIVHIWWVRIVTQPIFKLI